MDNMQEMKRLMDEVAEMNIKNITVVVTYPPTADGINNCKNAIEVIKTEKLIYSVLGKGNGEKLFPRLLAKYDELMNESYEISQAMVRSDDIPEGEYLTFCKETVKQRQHIKTLCDIGEKGQHIQER